MQQSRLLQYNLKQSLGNVEVKIQQVPTCVTGCTPEDFDQQTEQLHEWLCSSDAS